MFTQGLPKCHERHIENNEKIAGKSKLNSNRFPKSINVSGKAI